MSEEHLERIALALERIAKHVTSSQDERVIEATLLDLLDASPAERVPWWKTVGPSVKPAKVSESRELSAVEALTIRLAYGEITNPGALRMTKVEIDRLKSIADRFS